MPVTSGFDILAAIDVRDGRAVGHGWWTDDPGVGAAAAIARLAKAGMELFEVTAIDRDGLLAGPDIELYRRIVALGRFRIIASGGVTSPDDLRTLREIGCAGAIVGRALYVGRMTIAAALEVIDAG